MIDGRVHHMEQVEYDLKCPNCGIQWTVSVLTELGTIVDDNYDMCPNPDCEVPQGEGE